MKNNPFDITPEQRLDLVVRLKLITQALDEVQDIQSKRSLMSTPDGKSQIANEANLVAEKKFRGFQSMMMKTPDGKSDMSDPFTRLMVLSPEPRAKRSAFWITCLKNLKEEIGVFLEREADYKANKK